MAIATLSRGELGARLLSIHAAYDTVVIGGGLAGLCAAITARRHGVNVLLVEQAPSAFRGGDTRHARNCRIAHDAPSDFCAHIYPRQELANDIRSAAGEVLDDTLVDAIATGTLSLPAWLERQGVPLQARDDGAIPWSRKTIFLLGGGKRALNALYQSAESLGIDILYQCQALALRHPESDSQTILFRQGAAERSLAARTVVLCSGGYQADTDRLMESWGAAAGHFILRGRRHAGGDILRQLFALGAKPAGNQLDCHLVAVDARAPAADGGIVTRVDDFSSGLVLDCFGRLLQPVGKTDGKHRFAAWGRAIAYCPGQAAYLILKRDDRRSLRPPIYLPIAPATLDSIGRLPLAVKESPLLDVDRDAIIPMRPGLTFTTYGICTDSTMRIVWRRGQRRAGLFAAGMIMAGNLIRGRYLSGLATSLSAVTGRIAGAEAARHALQR